MSVNAKIKEDIENLFYRLMTRNFEAVALAERNAFDEAIGVLRECFPEQYRNALIKIKNPISILQRKNNRIMTHD